VTGSPAWKIVSAGAVSWLMASQRSSGCPLATMRLDAGPRPEVLGAASCLLACMDFESLIIRDGDRVAASGRLVRDSRGDWFQPSLPVALPGGVERTVRPAGRLAIRVVGADLDLVANRFEKAGAIEGWAAVEGVRSGEQLEVDRQSLPSPEPPWSHPWRTPPCPPPAGSWPKVTPRGDSVLQYDMGDLRATAAAVAVTLFRPADGAAVLVVAASDEAAVETQLRPQLGDLLCVVRPGGPRPSWTGWAATCMSIMCSGICISGDRTLRATANRAYQHG